MFGYAWTQGDVFRLTNGFDVAGNICHKKNDPIEGVPYSGMDMTSKPYRILFPKWFTRLELLFRFLFIDLVKTAEITGGDALNTVINETGLTLSDRSKATDNLEYCLGLLPTTTTTTTTTATTATTTTTTTPAAALLQKNFDRDSVRLAALTRVDEETGMVFRTSKLSAEEQISQSFSVSYIINGYGACRYCVAECPAGT